MSPVWRRRSTWPRLHGMGEPFSLALLGGAVLTEGVRFLFDQASTLIRAARQRRADAREAAETAAVVAIPVPANAVLDGPVAPTVDGSLLDRENRRLIALAGALAPYANGDAEIDPADGDLMVAMADVRALLEALYGQRLTLRGGRWAYASTTLRCRRSTGRLRCDSTRPSAGSPVTSSVSRSDGLRSIPGCWKWPISPISRSSPRPWRWRRAIRTPAWSSLSTRSMRSPTTSDSMGCCPGWRVDCSCPPTYASSSPPAPTASWSCCVAAGSARSSNSRSTPPRRRYARI
jgi:hypothetical protein